MFDKYFIDPHFMSAITLSSVLLIGIILYFFIYFTAQKKDFKSTTRNEYSAIHAVMISLPILFLSLILVSFIPPLSHTDKLSEAENVNQSQMIAKISEITGVEHVKKVNPSEYFSVDNLKNGEYVELSGIKDDKKQNVLIYFEKDKMNITVSNSTTDAQDIEKYTYSPKN